MGDLVEWIAVFGMVAIGVLFFVEIGRWRRMGPIMNRGQKVLRILLVLFIEALFLMMLVGPAATSRRDPLTSALYWMGCLILGLVVVVLALLDVRAVMRQYVRASREIFHDLRGDDRRKQ